MKKKIVLYLGEQPNMLGEIRHVLRDRDGKRYYYGKLKRYLFGESYVATDGTLPRLGEPLNDHKRQLAVTPEEETQYEALKLAVIAIRRRRTKAYNLKKPHADIVRAVELLRPFTRSLDSFDLHRFMQYLESQLTKPTGRRKR